MPLIRAPLLRLAVLLAFLATLGLGEWSMAAGTATGTTYIDICTSGGVERIAVSGGNAPVQAPKHVAALPCLFCHLVGFGMELPESARPLCPAADAAPSLPPPAETALSFAPRGRPGARAPPSSDS
jgi:hypothetical protein